MSIKGKWIGIEFIHMMKHYTALISELDLYILSIGLKPLKMYKDTCSMIVFA